MDRIVKVLISTNCELLVAPKTHVCDPGFVYLEFIDSKYTNLIDTMRIIRVPDVYKYQIQHDGLYMYYRIKIPTLTMIKDTNLAGRLYYDDYYHKLMIGDELVISSDQLKNIIDDDCPESIYGICEFIEYPVFSICRLSNCLENMQRKFIFHVTSDIKNIKCIQDKDNDQAIRDFLFSTVYILKILIKQQRYMEALRILESVQKCNMVCGDRYTSTKTDCGCK